MNPLVESLNVWASRFTDLVFWMFLQSSLLILLLLALDLLVRKKVRAVFRYGLWMLVLIKLVLPPSFASPTGLAYWLPERKTVKAHAVALAPVVVRYSDAQFDEMPGVPAVPTPRPKLRLAAWLLLGWLAVFFALFAWLARRSRRIAASTRRAFPASDSPEQLLEICRRQLRIRRRVRLKLSTSVSSPAVYGLWRPVILIPQRLADKLSALQLRAVLLHELAHVKRGDVLAHYAQTLLQIIYWWHPLLWLANARIRHLREQAVDETVMVEMGGEAEAYPATLLEVAKLTFQRPALVLGLIGIVESRSALARRINYLLERPVPKSARLGFSGLALVLLAGAFLLPMARAQRNPDGDVTAVAVHKLDELAVVDLDVEFISTADRGLEKPGLGQPTLVGPNGHLAWVLSSAQREDLLRRMERESVALSAPTITTTSGREAQVEISGVEPFKHPQAHATASCQVTPYLNGRLIDLFVSAKMTESGDVASVFADDRNPGPQQQTPENQSGQVVAADGVGHINYEIGAAQISVSDGESVALENPGLTGTNGKRMLVVVSPRVIRRSSSVLAPSSSAASAGAPAGDFRQAHVDNHVSPTPPRKSAQSQPTSTAAKDSAEVSARESVTVTIAKTEPHLCLGSKAVSLEDLKTEFKWAASLSPAATLLLRADKDVPIGEIVKVIDAAKEAGIKSVTLFTGPQTNGGDSLRTTHTNDATGRIGAKSPERPLNQPADAWAKSQSKPVSDGSISPSRSQRDRIPVLSDLPFFGPERKAIEAKLNQIILPEVAFDNVLLPQALQWLSQQAREHDPDGTGLNFLLNPNGVGAAPEAMIDPNTGKLVTLPRPEPLDMNNVRVRIKRPLRNVRLSDALEAVVKTADKPIRYSIEDYAVIFSPRPTETKQLETRTFKVDPNTFQHGLESFGTIPPGNLVQSTTGGAAFDIPRIFVPGVTRTNLTQSVQDTVRAFFTAAGVNVLPPNMIFFNDRTGMLMVRATPEELRRIQAAIDALRSNGSKISGRKIPASSTGATESCTANLEPKNSPGTEAGKSSKVAPDSSLVITLVKSEPCIYLGSRAVTLDELKEQLERATARNPNAALSIRADTATPTGKPADEAPAVSNPNNRTEAELPRPGDSSAALIQRVFRVDPGTFLEGLSGIRKIPHNSGTTNSIQEIQDAVRNFFAGAGVNVLPPNMLFFNPTSGVLVVRASAQELDLAQKAIEVLNVAPPLITIEAKFIELPTDAAQKLGFDLPSPGEVSNAWVRVLTTSQTRTVLQAAEQRTGVVILTAPKITTLSGRQTQIQVMEIQTIGNGLQSDDGKSLAFDWYLGNSLMSNRGGRVQGGTAPPGVQSANGVPAQPYVTSQVPVGPILDLIPSVAADGYTIHLTALPQVTEFLGADSTANGAEYTPVWIDGRKRNVTMPPPIIRTRSIHAAVDVYDGQTLVLANPRVTVVSKQSTGESVTNAIPEATGSRLIVFITPTIIDPAGSPIHTPGKEPWADKIPPQPAR